MELEACKDFAALLPLPVRGLDLAKQAFGVGHAALAMQLLLAQVAHLGFD